MKMYASDAWFFEEFDRIEPRNAIHYSVYAAWLVKQATGKDGFTSLKEHLSQVISLDGKCSGDRVAHTYWLWLEGQKKSS
jgi:hypothetical protein